MVDEGEDAALEDPEITGFLATLGEEISRIQEEFSYSEKSLAFGHWAIKQLSPSVSDTAAQGALATKGPPDRGIQMAWFDSQMFDRQSGIRGVYVVARIEFPRDFPILETDGSSSARTIQSALDWLTEPNVKPSRAATESVRTQFREFTVNQGRPCKFAILLCGYASGGLEGGVRDIDRILGKREDFGNLSCEVFDIHRLYNLYVSGLEERDLPIPEEAIFRIRSDYRTRDDDFAKALIAEVPLIEVYRLYGEFGLSLFAKNLRVPIASSPYNRGIQRTINDDLERPRFWFYNNGITATCEEYSIQARPGDPETATSVRARRLQIVNGCQTCASIFNAASAWEREGRSLDPLESTTVLLRVIETRKAMEADPRFSHRVARYTNSQTPITHRDLHATDPEQMRLKEEFARDWSFFLEVKKGEWKRRLERDREYKDKFNPPYVFSNEECGQAFVAFWKNEPAFAKASKRLLFEDPKRYEEIFGLENRAESLLLPTLLWYLEDEWRKKRGFVLRSRRRRLGVTQPEILRYGDLYLVSILGSSMKEAWKVDDASKLPPAVLKTSCRNARDLLATYRRPVRGKQRQLAGDLDGACSAALACLHDFVKGQCDADPELSVRNLLIRPSTWKDFEGNSGPKILATATVLVRRLESQS